MKINHKHTEFWYDNDSKIILFYGSKGAGKSYTIAQKILYRLVNEDGHRIVCIHKFYNKIRDTIYQQFVDIIKAEDLSEFFTITVSPFKIVCKQNKSEITFFSLDESKIGSTAGVTSVWIDEAHFISEEDWINLVASVGRSHKYKHPFQFILSFNPFGGTRHWINKRFFIENAYNAKIYKTTFQDNAYLSEDYESILDATKNNTAYYRAAKFGEFADVTDLQVFKNWEVYNPIMHKEVSFNIADYAGSLQVGLDFGHRHAACALLTATYEDYLVVFEEVYERELTTQQFINRILTKRWMKHWPYFCDSANPDKILELQQNGFTNAIGVKKYPGSISYGIDVLMRYKILILPTCSNLIDEIGAYSYKHNVKTNEIFNVPAEHQNDDSVDALRYSQENRMKQETEMKAVMALF